MSKNNDTRFDAPYDEEIENAVIGSVLIDADVLALVADLLNPDDFFLLRNQYVWEAILALHQAGHPIERTHLRRKLQDLGYFDSIGGDIYLSTLINSTPSAMYAEQFAQLVARDATRRRILMASDEIRGLAHSTDKSVEDILSDAMQHITKVQMAFQADRRYTTLRDEMVQLLAVMEAAQLSEEHRMGVPTGFKGLDHLLSGLQKSDFLILAGRPGMGKTSMALSIVANAATYFNARIAYFSLEMNAAQLSQRLVSMDSGIAMQPLRTGNLKGNQFPLFVEAAGRLSALPVFIDDSPSLTPEQLRLRAKQIQYERGLDLIVVDYVQLMGATGFNNNRVQEVAHIARQCKEIARELNVPMLALAQLNREVENRKDKRPKLSDLKDSGGLEQDADVVMFLYRDVVYNEATEFPNQADVIVAKHRNGPTDTIPLYFDAGITKFVDGTKPNIDLRSL